MRSFWKSTHLRQKQNFHFVLTLKKEAVWRRFSLLFLLPTTFAAYIFLFIFSFNDIVSVIPIGVNYCLFYGNIF